MARYNEQAVDFEEDVRWLLNDAETAGDFELASICRLALRGNTAALHEIRESLSATGEEVRP